MARPVRPLLALLISLAVPGLGAADGAKLYRWVGEDGRVYSGTAPPPDGKGLIDPPGPAPAPAPAAASPFPSYIAPAPAAAAVPAAPAPAAPPPDGDDCRSHTAFVFRWRDARDRAQSAQAAFDRLQSDTDFYLRRSDSSRLARLDAAERSAERAQATLDQVESDAARTGVPQRCLGD